MSGSRSYVKVVASRSSEQKWDVKVQLNTLARDLALIERQFCYSVADIPFFHLS